VVAPVISTVGAFVADMKKVLDEKRERVDESRPAVLMLTSGAMRRPVVVE
jgi:hypothetical protein